MLHTRTSIAVLAGAVAVVIAAGFAAPERNSPHLRPPAATSPATVPAPR